MLALEQVSVIMILREQWLLMISERQQWVVLKTDLSSLSRNWTWVICTLATSFEELTHWKRPWCWKGLGAGGEGGDRGWDGLMASLTQWAWVWVNSGGWWWTGRPAVLWLMGSQRVGHDWVTELNPVQYYSHIYKDETMPFPATGKKPQMIILSEVKWDREDRYHRISLLVESKNGYKLTSLQNRNRYTDLGKKVMAAKMERGSRD